MNFILKQAVSVDLPYKYTPKSILWWMVTEKTEKDPYQVNEFYSADLHKRI